MKFTRRKFLGTTLAGSLAVGAATTARDAPAASESPSPGLESHQREILRAAMDEIIPAGDGMPAASEVDGVEYLERLACEEPLIAVDLRRALEALEELSKTRLHDPFANLASPQRVEILTALEQSSPDVFGRLRDHVYESYYTQPRVWKLIGYDFHPTNASGPHMKPFDESVLAKVGKMPKLYREVSEG